MMSNPDARVAVVRRRLPAGPDVVYDEWTDPVKLAQWMCPRPARCLSVEIDPQVGGRFQLEIEEAGCRFRVSGRYLALERPRRLAFTWSCSTWPDPTVQSIVTVAIEPAGASASTMTIEHVLLPPDTVPQHARGWMLIGRQLETALRLRRPSPGQAGRG